MDIDGTERKSFQTHLRISCRPAAGPQSSARTRVQQLPRDSAFLNPVEKSWSNPARQLGGSKGVIAVCEPDRHQPSRLAGQNRMNYLTTDPRYGLLPLSEIISERQPSA